MEEDRIMAIMQVFTRATIFLSGRKESMAKIISQPIRRSLLVRHVSLDDVVINLEI